MVSRLAVNSLIVLYFYYLTVFILGEQGGTFLFFVLLSRFVNGGQFGRSGGFFVFHLPNNHRA